MSEGRILSDAEVAELEANGPTYLPQVRDLLATLGAANQRAADAESERDHLRITLDTQFRVAVNQASDILANESDRYDAEQFKARAEAAESALAEACRNYERLKYGLMRLSQDWPLAQPELWRDSNLGDTTESGNTGSVNLAGGVVYPERSE